MKRSLKYCQRRQQRVRAATSILVLLEFCSFMYRYIASFPEGAADLSNRKRKASETDALEKETKKFKEDSTTISV